jgi:hypothetical protein
MASMVAVASSLVVRERPEEVGDADRHEESRKRVRGGTGRRRWRLNCGGGTGLRPDEAAGLEYRDVSVVDDGRSGEATLEIEGRGTRG